MKYAGIIKNDIAAAPGVSLTFFVQGCPHHCKGCQNPETWDFLQGKEFTADTLKEVINSINANNIQRNFCIMGGEPLCPDNLFLTYLLTTKVKEIYPKIKIYIWTGYLYEDLLKMDNPKIKDIFNQIECLIDGPYIEDLKDITLQMRGSSNQRIINFDNSKKI